MNKFGIVIFLSNFCFHVDFNMNAKDISIKEQVNCRLKIDKYDFTFINDLEEISLGAVLSNLKTYKNYDFLIKDKGVQQSEYIINFILQFTLITKERKFENIIVLLYLLDPNASNYKQAINFIIRDIVDIDFFFKIHNDFLLLNYSNDEGMKFLNHPFYLSFNEIILNKIKNEELYGNIYLTDFFLYKLSDGELSNIPKHNINKLKFLTPYSRYINEIPSLYRSKFKLKFYYYELSVGIALSCFGLIVNKPNLLKYFTTIRINKKFVNLGMLIGACGILYSSLTKYRYNNLISSLINKKDNNAQKE